MKLSKKNNLMRNQPLQFGLISGLLLWLFMASSALSSPSQMIFTSAQEGADKLYESILKKDHAAVIGLFGEENMGLLPLDHVDEQDWQRFIEDWNQSHKLVAGKNDQFYIEVGTAGWTFPIPLEKSNKGWQFDTLEGADNIRIRLIGRNEISTMHSVLAYYDAQREYAHKDRNGNGMLEYAQKFVSTPGMKDGLYWETKPGEALSPLGHLFANNSPQRAYHGYYYKILTAQGNQAEGGAYSYKHGDRMNAGFAVIAWPAQYGDSGVFSFMISHNGTLYEKNLGPDSAQVAAEMTSFNPDEEWVKSEEQP